MKLPRLRTIILLPLVLFAGFYVFAAVRFAHFTGSEVPPAALLFPYQTIAIFGASGSAGDGILKAALADPGVQKIHVITRRKTPRMERGLVSGKLHITLHTDYLNYAPVQQQMAEADAVFWAIGTSSVGVDEQTYGRIHVDFPLRFVTQWSAVSNKPGISFHYISSSDISEDSRMMWAREKVRAEKSLFAFAQGTPLRVIAYRPDYIGPTREEAHPGQTLLYWFFAPAGAAVKAQQIGEAMMEVTARRTQFNNGDKLGTGSIIRYSNAYERRTTADSPQLPSG